MHAILEAEVRLEPILLFILKAINRLQFGRALFFMSWLNLQVILCRRWTPFLHSWSFKVIRNRLLQIYTFLFKFWKGQLFWGWVQIREFQCFFGSIILHFIFRKSWHCYFPDLRFCSGPLPFGVEFFIPKLWLDPAKTVENSFFNFRLF